MISLVRSFDRSKGNNTTLNINEYHHAVLIRSVITLLGFLRVSTVMLTLKAGGAHFCHCYHDG